MQITLELGPEGVGPSFKHAKKQVIIAYLEEAKGNVSRAAELMGISNSSLGHHIKAHNLGGKLYEIRKEAGELNHRHEMSPGKPKKTGFFSRYLPRLVAFWVLMIPIMEIEGQQDTLEAVSGAPISGMLRLPHPADSVDPGAVSISLGAVQGLIAQAQAELWAERDALTLENITLRAERDTLELQVQDLFRTIDQLDREQSGGNQAVQAQIDSLEAELATSETWFNAKIDTLEAQKDSLIALQKGELRRFAKAMAFQDSLLNVFSQAYAVSDTGRAERNLQTLEGIENALNWWKATGADSDSLTASLYNLVGEWRRDYVENR